MGRPKGSKNKKTLEREAAELLARTRPGSVGAAGFELVEDVYSGCKTVWYQNNPMTLAAAKKYVEEQPRSRARTWLMHKINTLRLSDWIDHATVYGPEETSWEDDV